MESRHLLFGLAAFAITVSTGAYADDIYKWTDEEGYVHYEDRPSGARSEERLQFSYNRTDNTAVQQRVQSRLDAAATRREAEEEREAEKRSAADTRAAAEEKLAKCQDYRQNMQTMVDARRVYREDENGERVYLDDAARAEARQKAADLIKETCGD